MIAARTPAEAAGALRALLQQAIACVTPAVLIERPPSPARTLTLVHTIPSPHGRVTIIIQHAFLLIHDQSRAAREQWIVRTTGYDYRLDAADGREILAYHWHPSGLSHEHRPHLHIGAGYGAIRPEWRKAHLLTGPLSPAALLELCITQLGVPPRRSDWSAVFSRLALALQAQEPAT